jgi:DNA-binding transcriptional LysR family regulator
MATSRQLETFLCVAECGSIRAAADRLGISQPSVSKQIRALETKLGGSLFARRRGAKIALSTRGESLRAEAQNMLHAQRAFERLATGGSTPRKLTILVRQYLFSTIECELSDTKLEKSGVELLFEIAEKPDLVTDILLQDNAVALLRSAMIISNPVLASSVLSVDRCSLYASPSYIARCARSEQNLSQCRVLIPQLGPQNTWAREQLLGLAVRPEHIEETGWYPGAILRRLLDGNVAAILLDSHVESHVAAGSLQAFNASIAPLYLQIVCRKALDSLTREELIQKVKVYFKMK